MSDLRIGIIGYGARGSMSHHAHRPGEGSVVTVVADPSERGRHDAHERYGDDVAYVESVDQLLAEHEVDAVMILAPDHAHAEIARTTLGRGIPTFTEKPMAITVEDADGMLELAREKRARLFVGHNMRHMPVIRQLKAIVDSGRIGRVRAIWCRHFVGTGGDFYFKDWHADRSKSTSLLLQKGAHDIDVIHWLAGGYTRRVSGIGELAVYGDVTDRRDNSDRLMWDWYDADVFPPTSQKELNPVIDVEDISMLHMTLDNGVLASYEQCHFTPDYWRNYTVIGTQGRAENFGDGDGGVVRVWKHRSDYRPLGDAEYPIVEGGAGHSSADELTVAEFLNFVRTGAPTDTSPLSARDSVAAGVAATESLRQGSQPRVVPTVPDAVADYFLNHQISADKSH